MKTYSFRKRLYTIFYTLITLQLTGVIVCSAVFSYTYRRSLQREARQTLSLYNAQISQNLRSVDYYLMEVSNYSREVSLVATLSDIEGHYGDVIRINNLFELSLRSFPNILGLYAYFPASDTWIGYSDTAESRQTIQPYIRSRLRSSSFLDQFEGVNGLMWMPVNFDGRTYFVKTFYTDETVLGAWTDIDLLSSALTSLQDRNTLIYYVNAEGRCLPAQSAYIPEDDGSSLRIPDASTDDQFVSVRIEGENYLVITEDLDYCNYAIAALIPLSELRTSQRSVILFAGSALLITLAAFLITRSILNRFSRQTVTVMQEVSDNITAGDTDSRIDLDGQRCEEVLAVSKAYNHMADSMQALRINVYEEQISRRTFQLHFLRSQVAPHFLINCLNMIGYLADGTAQHTQIIRQMIETLSRHLRYTLSTNDNVPLSQELEYLENYVELSKLRFPGCITYETDIEEAALTARVFPLLLIMLAENTFKYNLVMGEPLTVIARAKVQEIPGQETHCQDSLGQQDSDTIDSGIDPGTADVHSAAASDSEFTAAPSVSSAPSVRQGLFLEQNPDARRCAKRLHLTYIDSGSGYGEDFLQHYREHPDEEFVSQDGTHIGMQNIRHRLRLYYGDSAVLAFSNEPGMGARTDIDLPFITAAPEG